MSKISIIGSGFSGLSAAAVLADKGHQVQVFEKNEQIGGRARTFQEMGYTFDMGPSWYWMPDVFEKFFHRFDKKLEDYVDLIQLDPGFQIIFSKENTMRIDANWDSICELFESVEKGSADKLHKFMKEAEFKYDFGINKMVYQPGLSLLELVKPEIVNNVFKLQMFTSYRKHVEQHFKNPYLRSLLEFPVLFLGTAPSQTPALYSLMTYSGIKQGTFYPMGGFGKVIDAFAEVCKERGVEFFNNENIEKINVNNKIATSMTSNNRTIDSDVIIGSADYHHIENSLLDEKHRNYSPNYWEKRTFSPSSLIFYIGVNKKLDKLIHHNLFFDEDIEQHTNDIYDKPVWPKKPLFYACCPSKTDQSLAPIGKENLFLLMPIAPGLEDSEEIRKEYFNIMIKRLEEYTEQEIESHVEYKRGYCIKDFVSDYNAYKGNAYGLANTLAQTANLKPKIVNKKIKNLFYTGQLTVPGPGVPPSIISGQVVAQHILDSKLI
jgi:phytoene desaturase